MVEVVDKSAVDRGSKEGIVRDILVGLLDVTGDLAERNNDRFGVFVGQLCFLVAFRDRTEAGAECSLYEVAVSSGADGLIVEQVTNLERYSRSLNDSGVDRV